MNVSSQDFITIGIVAFLEGILSVDNALVLALIASRLPRDLQRRALTYGLFGAVVFRLAALALVSLLLRLKWMRAAGSAYLIFLAIRHLIRRKPADHGKPSEAPRSSFWRTVATIELMDIAFAIDSILAAVALSHKFWVVFTGGMIGVVLMRFAASVFLQLLRKFPGFETSAYLLILIIGAKLGLELLGIPGVDFSSATTPASLAFWGAMALALLFGFRRRRA